MSVQTVFSKNRTEELGYDVWQHFVVPPFYHRLDVQNVTKPMLIIGGRGCGKTMLLRYWSHQSMFSLERKTPPEADLKQIGLYWRADTQFASAMIERDIPIDTWQSAFSHMAAIIIGMEILSSLRSVTLAKFASIDEEELHHVDLSRLKAFESSLPSSVDELFGDLEQRLWSFESWVNDVRKCEEPRFLPGQKFVIALIKEIQGQLPRLKESNFLVFIDEYENLCSYQKQIINTWLKHSEPPLIFNLAMKRNAFEMPDTTGPESLSNIHDFRVHDLEKYFLEEDSEIFFAEILFLKLANAGLHNPPLSINSLRNPDRLNDRKQPAYRAQVIDAVENIFPDVSLHELAEAVIADRSLTNKLRSRIKGALDQRKSVLSVDDFFKPSLPEATVTAPVLLYRKRNTPEEVASEMRCLEKGEQNHFTGPRDWIQNNFVGSLLQLYEPYDRACPFYAGFHTFLLLARGNIRHFLELCYRSIERTHPDGDYEGQQISPQQQAEAARQASTDFLGEVRSFGRYGNRLHFFVLGLGSLFALSHLRPTLSESEQSHFSVVSGSDKLTERDQEFLREATKWSVLFEEEATKIKQSYQPETTEYILNPIYAPYFHISYRKKRKLELKSDDLILLIRGSYDDVSGLLKRYSRQWSIEASTLHPTLFSHLMDRK